jgi:CHAT domain-containing protein
MKRVFFAPNNLLSNIAVEYLKVGEKTFFETREVYRLSSTKELCREYKPIKGKRICLFGDIDYDLSDVSAKRGAVSFGRLEYSKQEIDGIVSSVSKRYKVDMYNGKKATEMNFKKVPMHSPSILHISSHGEYWGDSKMTMDEAMENSILAFSGINVSDQPEDNDGMVSAADVANMNLRQCELAVLSACETGLGGLGADGVFGLQRGFKNAGVHTLLMSLKSVYDESTALLMVEFYKGLAEGMSKREALVKAQKKLRSQQTYSKGEYWAPFILLDAWEGE